MSGDKILTSVLFKSVSRSNRLIIKILNISCHGRLQLNKGNNNFAANHWLIFFIRVKKREWKRKQLYFKHASYGAGTGAAECGGSSAGAVVWLCCLFNCSHCTNLQHSLSTSISTVPWRSEWNEWVSEPVNWASKQSWTLRNEWAEWAVQVNKCSEWPSGPFKTQLSHLETGLAVCSAKT